MATYTFNPYDSEERTKVRYLLDYIEHQSAPSTGMKREDQTHMQDSQPLTPPVLATNSSANSSFSFSAQEDRQVVLLLNRISSLQTELTDCSGKFKAAQAEITKLKEELDKTKSENKDLNDWLERELAAQSTNKQQVSKVLYFLPNGNRLSETNRSDAPYLGYYLECPKKVEYRFNIDDGRHIEVCSDIEKQLTPFCEITERDERANRVENEENGEAEFNGNYLTITKKAKIKLIKTTQL